MNRLASLLIVLPLLLAGCASTPQHPAPPPLFADASFKPPSEPIGAQNLFTLSPAMQAYIHSPAFEAHLRSKGLEQGLIDALYSKTDLKLEYDSSRTRTAAETYAARAGNCLSLVVMTAAFARELGMTVHFRSVMADETWSRDGGIYLVSSHVNIALGHRRPNGLLYDETSEHELVVDFLPPPDASRLRSRQLEEDDIVALYLNNRAAESLVQGNVDDAYWWARAAVATNPPNAIAYNTLGVIYQRHGDLVMAERALRTALEREPESIVVMQNLGPLLAATGRPAEAAEMARRVAAVEPVPPFQYFDKGMVALKAGDYDAARKLFEREVKRAPYYDEFHFWLAVTLLRLGQAKEAREELTQAIDTSTKSDNRQLYSAKLAHLRRQSANSVQLY
ncbi:tetratricopeptide repeat protein [Massilia putida]|uniref:tetratricopeptide repeat protein n=1 Tax=Massilia putida TaxID=1141883 RepID=UPI0009512E3C|nr:tetratricopeptide repeat protein [Massilia putida]